MQLGLAMILVICVFFLDTKSGPRNPPCFLLFLEPLSLLSLPFLSSFAVENSTCKYNFPSMHAERGLVKKEVLSLRTRLATIRDRWKTQIHLVKWFTKTGVLIIKRKENILNSNLWKYRNRTIFLINLKNTHPKTEKQTKKITQCQAWWHMPIILAFGR